jgi:maltose alpha-D-glucosyltransferase/alpha-amylase
VHSLAAGAELPFAGGVLRFQPTSAWNRIDVATLAPVQHFGNDHLETKVLLGDAVLLKVYRLAEPGINPDIEMPAHLAANGFANVAVPGGAVNCEIDDTPPIALAALHAYVRNQGDAWTFTMDHLDRFAAGLRTGSGTSAAPHALFHDRMTTLGRRIGEMHAILSRDTPDPAFTPEPMGQSDLEALAEALLHLLDSAFDRLHERIAQMTDAARSNAQSLLEMRSDIASSIRALSNEPIHAIKMRHHGNLQLRKTLLVEDDFVITDFDGLLDQPLEMRRGKHSCLRDIAAVMCSLRQAHVAALHRTLDTQPDLRDRVEPALEAWRSSTIKAFHDGYRRGLGKAPCLPDSADADRLMELYQMEFTLRQLDDDLERNTAETGNSIEALLRLRAGS